MSIYITMTSLAELAQNTKKEIKGLTKPLSAYQYYTKHFREQWTSMDEEKRDDYLIKSKQDKERYETAKEEIKEKERDEVRTIGIYLARSYDHVNCVGLDNGWHKSECVGPAEELVEFSPELQELYGVKYKRITISGLTWKFNETYKLRHKGSIYTIGRGWKKGMRMYLTESKKQYHTRFVRNCFDKTWEEKLEPSFYAVGGSGFGY